MKFNLIYEEILKNTLSLKNFDYTFNLDTDTEILQCKFQSIDKNTNNLIFITATINKDIISFEIFSKDHEKVKEYTEKEFLMAYYKEYQNFKQVYKLYKKDPNFFNKKENNQQNDQSTNQSNVKINTLDEVLQDETIKDNGFSIKIENTVFTFKQLQENKLNNVVTCSFNLINNATFKNDSSLDEYNAIATIKIFDVNSKILKIELFENIENEAQQPVKVFYQQDFKNNFKDDYFNLKAALTLYQNHYQKQNKQGI